MRRHAQWLRRMRGACYLQAMRRPLHDRGFRGRFWAFLVSFLGFACLPGGPASAHPQFALSTVNRYGKLVLVSARQARVFFTLMIGDVPALALRQQADRNGDGTLDAAEQQGLAALLRDRVASGVHIYRGEAELPLPWEASPLQLDSPTVAATAFACEISATLPLLGGAAPKAGGGAAEDGLVDELRYDDRVDLAPVGEIELRVEEGPGMRVLKVQSSLSAPPPAGGAAPPQLLFQWSGPPRSSLSDRSVRVRFAAAGPAAMRRRPAFYPTRWPWLVGGLLAALALVAGFRLRRLGRPA